MESLSANWVNRISIDLSLCQGCGACVNACFVDVLRWDAAARQPLAAYPEDCVWCLACECACPAQCIEVIPNIPAPLKSSY